MVTEVFFVTRDCDGNLKIHIVEPERLDDFWYSEGFIFIDDSDLPHNNTDCERIRKMTFENEPIKVCLDIELKEVRVIR